MRRSSIVLPLVAACGHTDVQVGDLQEVLTMPATPNPDLDILFLIDDSPSMADKQASLVTNFPRMVDALGMLPGGLPNLHIGVATSDMGTTGSLDAQPGPSIGAGMGACNGVGNDGALQPPMAVTTGEPFLVDIANPDGTRMTNYTGELRDAFAQVATVGDSGCGFEQHFAAIRRAVANPLNAGFVRDQANLAVIILADEDDCSLAHAAMLGVPDDSLGPLESFRCTRFGIACDQGGVTTDDMNTIGGKDQCHSRADSPYVEDVSSFVDFLSKVKGDPRRVMIGAIVGDPTPVAVEMAPPPGGGTAIPSLAHSCTFQAPSGMEVADPAVRIAQVVDAFPGRGALTSVCSEDLTLSLTSIGYSARQLVGDPCVNTPLADTSSEPGVQPLCTVTDRSAPDAAGTDVPACTVDAGNDCWRIVADPTGCPQAPDNLRLEITRSAPPPANVFTSARCLIAN